jgi:hypothetical protein
MFCFHHFLADADSAFASLAKSEFVVSYVLPFSKKEWTLA